MEEGITNKKYLWRQQQFEQFPHFAITGINIRQEGIQLFLFVRGLNTDWMLKSATRIETVKNRP